MADDDPAINSGLNLSYINLYMKLFNYREQCQDRLARLTMLPPDYSRYIQLRSDFLFGSLPYPEFSIQMYGDLLLQNPNYAPLCVYWADYDRFRNEGIQVVDSPLFTFPTIQYASMVLPIAPDDVAQFQILGSQLWNQVPEQSRIPFSQQVRNLQYACRQELARHQEHYRQYYRQQELARQQEHHRQQEMVEEEQQIQTRFWASEEKRLKKNRGYRKTWAEKKKRLQREREQDPESSTDSSIDSDDDGA